MQIQEPTSGSTTTRAFVFLAKFVEFYYHKIFEARSQWPPKPLRGWTEPLWPLYNWRHKDLSMSLDWKVMKGNYPQWRNALSTSITELLLLPKFNNSVTQDKEICHLIMSCHYYHLRRSTHGTFSMMFTCCPSLMFLASP